MKHLLAFILVLFFFFTMVKAQELKPRLVVMTDIGPAEVEPDDNESAVRLLSYADRFEIEAICTTIGWNCDPYPAAWADYLYRVVDAYEKDVKNLMRRSGQKDFLPIQKENGKQKLGYWSSAEYLRSRVMMGSQRAGIAVIGEGNDSPGSDFLIKLAQEDDPRPIWVTSWGGSNTLAQAIWRVKQTATEEELKAFVRKFRIYTITDQDMQYSMRMNRAYSSHQWLRQAFADDLLFIWDESAWLNQNELGKQNWKSYESLIQNHGNMGKVYPTFKWGVEGDTPSFLHLMPNGLNNPEDPAQVGWGGYHILGMAPDSITRAWTNWQQPTKSISNDYEHRFYPDEFGDFAARMAWANDGKGNTNPVVIVNGKKGVSAIYMKAKAGKDILLDASRSKDAEGDELSFSWWQQTEAGSFHLPVVIEGATTSKARIHLPEQSKGKEIHIICEVHDNGAFHLVSYRRIIIKVK
ncbi:MAG: DUF1593 domain-containing protein [Bacteroidaceae bacterium]|nr:DUF1593 domain-containing protein [Bacteroidaceae bacterium]